MLLSRRDTACTQTALVGIRAVSTGSWTADRDRRRRRKGGPTVPRGMVWPFRASGGHPEVRAAYAEAQAADAELKEMASLLNAEAPRLRYELRQEAFYTDLIVDADEEHAGRMRWRRPSDIRLDEAHQRILNTVNDYAGVLDTTFTCVIEENAAFSAALEAWGDKPPLPAPVWPKRVEK